MSESARRYKGPKVLWTPYGSRKRKDTKQGPLPDSDFVTSEGAFEPTPPETKPADAIDEGILQLLQRTISRMAAPQLPEKIKGQMLRRIAKRNRPDGAGSDEPQ